VRHSVEYLLAHFIYHHFSLYLPEQKQAEETGFAEAKNTGYLRFSDKFILQ